jgi:hypothetical protein
MTFWACLCGAREDRTDTPASVSCWLCGDDMYRINPASKQVREA